MAPALYPASLGLLGIGFYLTALFTPDDDRPPRSRNMRLLLGFVLLIWYGLSPLLRWQDLSGMPPWAEACFLIGTGFGAAAGLLLIKRNASAAKRRESA